MNQFLSLPLCDEAVTHTHINAASGNTLADSVLKPQTDRAVKQGKI